MLLAKATGLWCDSLWLISEVWVYSEREAAVEEQRHSHHGSQEAEKGVAA